MSTNLPATIELLEFRDAVPILVHDLNGDEVEVVDFKTVHAVLGSGTRIDNWFKRLVTKYDFKQGEDFITLELDPMKKADWGKIKANGSKTLVTYYMTLDMAKEVCMVSASPIGQRVRRYFILAEKVAKKHALSHLKAALQLEVSKAETKALTFKAQADGAEKLLQDGVKKMGFQSVVAMQNKILHLSDEKEGVGVPQDHLVSPRWKSLAKQTILKVRSAMQRKDQDLAKALLDDAYADLKRGEEDEFSCYFRGDCQ